MADSNVSISFGADASDFLDGVARVSAALQTLPANVTQVTSGVDRSSQSFAAFGAGAANALGGIADAARATGASQQEIALTNLVTISEEISAERAAFAEKKSLYDALTRLKVMGAGERLSATQAALDEEFAAESALRAKELQLDDLSARQRQQVLKAMLALDAKYALDSQKVMMQAAAQMAAPMDHVIDSVASSFSSGLTGMIVGTRTLSQALAALARSIVSQFVRMGVELVADWGKRQVALVALAVAGESQKTAAATAGAAARGGIAGGEAAGGLSAIIANAARSIAVSAGEAGAGATAFMAPLIGPAAIAEGAAVKGAVLSMATYDIGAWQIDQDQIAMVHRNEMVMPAAEAGAFRSMLSGAANQGGASRATTGSGASVHLNVNALDAGSVKNWLGGNSRQIMKAINQAVADGNHLGLRRLAGV